MPGVIYYSSSSRNTARMIARLDLPQIGLFVQRIAVSPSEPLPEPEGEYVLMLPTFADGEGRGAVPKQVIRFLNDPAKRAGIRGVIAAGNRNFGATYALAGRQVAQKCNVPLLYKFELAGDENDTARIREGLLRFWGIQCSTMV